MRSRRWSLNPIWYPILQFVLQFNNPIAIIKYSHKRSLSPSYFITNTRVQTGTECVQKKITIWSWYNNLLDVYRCLIRNKSCILLSQGKNEVNPMKPYLVCYFLPQDTQLVLKFNNPIAIIKYSQLPIEINTYAELYLFCFSCSYNTGFSPKYLNNKIRENYSHICCWQVN